MGRPERPTILALEAHVEEIVVLKDASERERRAAVTINHLGWHAQDAFNRVDGERHGRALQALHRLALHLAAASKHLDTVVIPLVQDCYSALETAVAI